MIAAIFVEEGGVYYGLDGVDPWPKSRDAKRYQGPHPVVAHPPCNLWVNFAALNFKRWGGEHNRPGNDDGCFESALGAVKKYGGVLEHPADSNAWKKFKLTRPLKNGGWYNGDGTWVCEVWQSAYGHKARKRTWLLYSGKNPPFELDWRRVPGTHQIGRQFTGPNCLGEKARKPVLAGKKASATPVKFRDTMIELALHSAGISVPCSALSWLRGRR